MVAKIRLALGALLAGFALAASGAASVTNLYVWTGARDAYWTNAANWTVGGAVPLRCPGVIETNGMTTAELAAIASAAIQKERDFVRFDAPSPHTTIDLDGLFMTDRVLVTGAETPTYTFGTSSNQVFRFMAVQEASKNYDAACEFRIAADVAHMPVVKARFAVCQTDTVSGWSGGFYCGSGFAVANENAQPFAIEAIGGIRALSRTVAAFSLYLPGPGPITLAASPTDDATKFAWRIAVVAADSHLRRDAVTVTVRGTVRNIRMFYIQAGEWNTAVLHLSEGSCLQFPDPVDPSLKLLDASYNRTGWSTYYCYFRITGTGTVKGVDYMQLITFSSFYPHAAGDLPKLLEINDWPNAIFLPAGADAVITNVSPPSAQYKDYMPLSIYRDTPSSVRVTGLAGQAWPWWLRLDDQTGSILSDGLLTLAPVSTDVEIAAKGDTVPNNDAVSVGVTSEGSGANTKLASAATAVKSLVHYATCPATIAIGSGQTLTAGSVVRSGTAGALTLGEKAGVGSLAAAKLMNENGTGALTVNATLTGAQLAMTNANHVTLAGGTGAEMPLFVQHGHVEMTGETPFAFNLAVLGNRYPTILQQNMRTPVMDVRTTLDVHDTTLVIGDGREGFAVGRDPGVETRLSNCQNDFSSMTIRNATVYSTVPLKVHTDGETANGSTIGALSVGNTAHASLEILEGAVVSNRLIVGGLYGLSNYPPDDTSNYFCPRGIGGVYQRDGSVTLVGSSVPDYAVRYGSAIGAGSLSIGYYELSGGTLRGIRTFVVQGASSTDRITGGILEIAGGTLVAEGQTCFGNGNTTKSVVRQTGGTATVNGDLLLARSWSGGSHSSFTLDGTNASFTVNGHILVAPSASAGVSNYCVSANLNAGVLKSQGFGTGKNARAPDAFIAVTFNGGTFRVGRADMDLFVHRWPTSYNAVDHVYVFDGGATIDTAGLNASSSVPFEGVKGGGVTGVTDFVPYRDVAPSPVRIVGDGTGAQAVMLYDSVTQTATGIRIVCPGFGYTYAEAWYDSGVYSTTRRTLACTVAANANAGSLTKAGEGTLALNAANTYGGKTVLAGGTLALNVPKAYPTASPLVPGEGILRVTKTGALPDPMTVDASGLDKTKNYDSIVFDELPSSIPKFNFVGSRATWRARLMGRKIRFASRTGLIAIVH